MSDVLLSFAPEPRVHESPRMLAQVRAFGYSLATADPPQLGLSAGSIL